MMEQALVNIIERARNLFYNHGVRSVSMDDIARDSGVSRKHLYTLFISKKILVERLLELERENFAVIFYNYNFDGVNAIDILLTVSNEIRKNFTGVSPSFTFDLNRYYPEIYHKHMEARIDFIFGKIKINLEKGINQGIYRTDLSVELVSRLYMRRLIDLHNPEFFPPDQFSFETLYDVMFDHFIRGIANEVGLAHYEKQKSKANLQITT